MATSLLYANPSDTEEGKMTSSDLFSLKEVSKISYIDIHDLDTVTSTESKLTVDVALEGNIIKNYEIPSITESKYIIVPIDGRHIPEIGFDFLLSIPAYPTELITIDLKKTDLEPIVLKQKISDLDNCLQRKKKGKTFVSILGGLVALGSIPSYMGIQEANLILSKSSSQVTIESYTNVRDAHTRNLYAIVGAGFSIFLYSNFKYLLHKRKTRKLEEELQKQFTDSISTPISVY